MRYYFNHYGSDIPRELTVAFDNRYTAQRTCCLKYMERIFDSGYIQRFAMDIKKQPITLYWPDFCKVEWKKVGNNYQSKVVVAKTNANIKIGAEILEMWDYDPATRVVKGVRNDVFN